jgi:hypothetical protein
MSLHIIKLCVGCDGIEDLRGWIDGRLAARRDAGLPPEQSHVTRMFPRRHAEIAGSGSLYWVIKGYVQVRQPILAFHPVVGEDGIERCKIVLEPTLIETEWQPRRPFQGWRYLEAKDAARDIASIPGGDDMPVELRRSLAELGLL